MPVPIRERRTKILLASDRETEEIRSVNRRVSAPSNEGQGSGVCVQHTFYVIIYSLGDIPFTCLNFREK